MDISILLWDWHCHKLLVFLYIFVESQTNISKAISFLIDLNLTKIKIIHHHLNNKRKQHRLNVLFFKRLFIEEHPTIVKKY